MNTIDYQQQCGLTRYPFRDNATLVWTSGSTHGELPNSIFRDAKLTVFSGSISAPQLTAISFDGANAIVSLGGYTLVVPATIGINTYTAKNSTALLCVDIDNDELTNYFTTIGAGAYTFDASCTLCLSCIKVLPPNITRFKLINTLPASTATIYDNSVVGSGVPLVEGTNVGFTVTDNLCNVDVNRGLGAGQYDGCGNDSSNLLTINTLSPDAKGNYLIGNDFCYSTYRTPEGLHLKNTCKPQCTSDDILNTADYYNRVGDLTNQLSTYVGATNNGYNSWLSTIETLESNKNTYALGYVLANASTSANRAKQYHNIGIGLYYPHFKSPSSVLKASYNTSEFQLVPGTYYNNEENTKRVLPDFTPNTNIASELVNCQSTKFYGFVLQQNIASGLLHNNLGSSLYDLHLNLRSTNVGNSGFVLPINPKSFNFTVKYSIQNIHQNPSNLSSAVLSRLVKFDLMFIDPTGATSNVTLNTNVSSLGSILTNQTKCNNVVASYISPGFVNVSMNGLKDNHYYLTLSCPVTVYSAQTINFSASGISGSANKSIIVHFL
jgi:hypothetical protein